MYFLQQNALYSVVKFNVEFNDEENETYSVIPTFWLKDKYTYWPKKDVRKCIIKRKTPHSDWTLYPVFYYWQIWYVFDYIYILIILIKFLHVHPHTHPSIHPLTHTHTHTRARSRYTYKKINSICN